MNVRSMLWNHTLDGRLQLEESWMRARTRLDAAITEYNDIKRSDVGGETLGNIQRLLGDAIEKFEKVLTHSLTHLTLLTHSPNLTHSLTG